MNRLDMLEAQSIYILREAYKHFGKLGLLWSIGKDSTVLLWIARKAFFGHIPFPVVHIDTTFKFPEMYSFRDRISQEWGFNLIVEKNEKALKKGIHYDTHDALTVCHELKTVGLQQCIEKHQFDGLILAIRSDEEGSRSKERFFSKRDADFNWDYTNQAPEFWDQYTIDFKKGEHIRVHPVLHWTEVDMWEYIKREGIPMVDLYFAKNGKRYRSLGCMPITHPVDSSADTHGKIITELQSTKKSERSGRAQDDADRYALQKLRAKGYM